MFEDRRALDHRCDLPGAKFLDVHVVHLAGGLVGVSQARAIGRPNRRAGREAHLRPPDDEEADAVFITATQPAEPRYTRRKGEAESSAGPLRVLLASLRLLGQFSHGTCRRGSPVEGTWWGGSDERRPEERRAGEARVSIPLAPGDSRECPPNTAPTGRLVSETRTGVHVGHHNPSDCTTLLVVLGNGKGKELRRPGFATLLLIRPNSSQEPSRA